jgi:phage tail sheath protein FI
MPIRRLGLYIEQSVSRGTQWDVCEPNDERLWARIRETVTVFMHDLFLQGAFRGESPAEGYFVKCDAETTTQADRDLGVVNIFVGFAPLDQAGFVVIRIHQFAGQGQE